jgi:hypothetical protein
MGSSLAILTVFAFFLTQNDAHAALGEKYVKAEKEKLADSTASSSDINSSGKYFTVHITSEDAMTIKEYESKVDGTIFALTWKGLNHPDLSPLLGNHFEEYKQANKTPAPRKIRSSHRVIQSGDLIVEKYGHMGAMQGRAYLKTLIPPGVTENDIK